MSRVIEEENDPEVLKVYARFLFSENERQKKVIDILQAQKAKEDQLALGIDDRLVKLKKMVFGKKSEKRRSQGRRRDKEDKLMLTQAQSLVPEPSEKEMAVLPSPVVEHRMNVKELLEEARIRGYENVRIEDWEEMTGFYDDSIEVDIIERGYKKTIHRRIKFRLKPSRGSDKEVIVTSPGPDKLIPGGSIRLILELA